MFPEPSRRDGSGRVSCVPRSVCARAAVPACRSVL